MQLFVSIQISGVDNLRREMDTWNFYEEGESPHELLARFLIAVDELRARLNPGVYPPL